MKKFLRDNGLTLTMFGLFLLFLVGQAVAGFYHYNAEQQSHGVAELAFVAYLGTGHFIEAVFENWESEFLQMGSYVFLTVYLFQRGSAESKPLTGPQPVDADPVQSRHSDSPWPVRRGGWVLRLYENSLGLAFLALFLLSLGLHAVGGADDACRDNRFHNQSCDSTLAYMQTARFWFESFQNWQSEFLAVGSIVLLSVFLRQRGSPESKPVAAPDDETGAA